MVRINPSSIKNILIIRKHNQIGDMIVSIPMYYALKKTFPESRITLLASKTNYKIPFSEINPYIDDVIIYDKIKIQNAIKLIKQLRKLKFDLVIIPSTVRFSTTHNIISFLAGIKYRVGVSGVNGSNNKLSFLLNIKTNFNWIENKTHQIFRNLEVIEQIGCKLNFSEIFDSFPKISEKDETEIKKILDESFNEKNILIGIHPGAGKTQNIWDSEKFLSLIKNLYQNYQANFIITGGFTDEEIIQKIQIELVNSKIPFLLAQNYEFRKLMSLINQCDLFISNDTGVMHIAGLTNTVLVGLMKKGNVREWAPMWKNKFYVSSPTNNINDLSLEEVQNFCNKVLNLTKWRKKLV